MVRVSSGADPEGGGQWGRAPLYFSTTNNKKSVNFLVFLNFLSKQIKKMMPHRYLEIASQRI